VLDAFLRWLVKKWPSSRDFRLKGHNGLLTNILFVSLFGLFDQLNQTGDLGLGFGLHQAVELVFRQSFFHVLHHVKMLPPAVQDFKARMLIVTADFAVLKWHGIAQARASPYQGFV